MMQRNVLLASALAVAAGLWSGCERSDQPASTAQPAPSASASTQPTSDEIANVREVVDRLGQRSMDALPAGHPPIGPAADGPLMPDLPPTTGPAVKLIYTAPDTWQQEPVRGPLRVDQYRLPRAPGDAEDAELTVFGSNIGGGVEANVQFWRGQFSLPDGQPIPDVAVVRQTIEVNELTITLVDIAGRFQPRAMMPGAPAPAPQDGYRMLGVIVETPGGPWYFKAVGPAETIGRHRAAFVEFLHTMKIE